MFYSVGGGIFGRPYRGRIFLQPSAMVDALVISDPVGADGEFRWLLCYKHSTFSRLLPQSRLPLSLICSQIPLQQLYRIPDPLIFRLVETLVFNPDIAAKSRFLYQPE